MDPPRGKKSPTKAAADEHCRQCNAYRKVRAHLCLTCFDMRVKRCDAPSLSKRVRVRYAASGRCIWPLGFQNGIPAKFTPKDVAKMRWMEEDYQSHSNGASKMVVTPPTGFRYIVQSDDNMPPDSADVGPDDPLGLWGSEVQISTQPIDWHRPAGWVSVQYTMEDLDNVPTPRTPSDTEDDCDGSTPIGWRVSGVQVRAQDKRCNGRSRSRSRGARKGRA
jgi:hypothetical protein